MRSDHPTPEVWVEGYPVQHLFEKLLEQGLGFI
jgi:hypothetical protein